jgi:hypothetical protein
MNFHRAIILVSLVIIAAFMSLPIVRARNGRNCPEGHRKPCNGGGKKPCGNSKPCNTTPVVCQSQGCSTLTQTFAPQTMTMTNCCSPIATASVFPSYICSTVVMCGATDSACIGERISRFNNIASEMIQNSQQALVYVNNVLTSIGSASASVSVGTSVITVS